MENIKKISMNSQGQGRLILMRTRDFDAFQVLEYLYYGVLLLDRKGNIKYANKLARQLVAEGQIELSSYLFDKLFPEITEEVPGTSWTKVKTFKLGSTDVVGSASIAFIDEQEYKALCFQKLEDLEPLYKELIVTKKELEEIFDSSYDEIFTADGDGTALRISAEACERLYGVKPEQLIGRNVMDLEAEGYFFPSSFPEVVREKKRVTVLQTNKLGQKTIVTSNPILDGEGNVVRLVSNSRDITELVNLREQLQETELKMQQYYKELMLFKQGTTSIENIIAESPNMLQVMNLARKIAKYDSTVLLLGESGVGKDLIAKYVHHFSRRADGPFVKINCGAIPDNLLESELFGYEGGAFTGARKEGKKGLIEEAEGGTLFLDEIAELPYHLQVKLLTVIEERIIVSIGGSKPKTVDTRIIAATNRDIADMVKKGTFREDLFYRLNVISLHIPPLRERPDDIKRLCHFFVNRFNKQFDLQKSISPEAMKTFLAYPWPGNVRQLENCIERFLVMAEEDVLSLKHLPADMGSGEMEDARISATIKIPESSLENEREGQAIYFAGCC
jgi:PAS domain S-box-containing protein